MQKRISSALAVIAIGAVFAVSWYVASRPAEVPAATPETIPAASVPPPAATIAVVNQIPPAKTQLPIAQLIADVTSGDAGKRAAAIAALAEAPRAEALPALSRVLTDGEPQVDRPLALRSLRDLALKQGDADGAIRDAVRDALYHGDDYTRIEDVQEVLDVIERSELR